MLRRELLLVEIERRCPECGARVCLGLTKAEARTYRGFQCERCEAKTGDVLTERDVPEWWDELMIRSLDRSENAADSSNTYEPESPVARLNEAARRTGEDFREAKTRDDKGGAKEI